MGCQSKGEVKDIEQLQTHAVQKFLLLSYINMINMTVMYKYDKYDCFCINMTVVVMFLYN